ncbi:hypothetical protein [Rhodohalobacter sulfatireducens]|uniref:Uncharacterized protein n=1 Tax=Rhodohalobacter sulfatireducens TaxID=2911366 RepID=A0ABS9KIU9_9BACT|nr:hypothetical protein [Rhodohalobacter sulfatireducens]MCG2590772.1 hypothetical protein [Rhodohalobacter sulfatireducens]
MDSSTGGMEAGASEGPLPSRSLVTSKRGTSGHLRQFGIEARTWERVKIHDQKIFRIRLNYSLEVNWNLQV